MKRTGSIKTVCASFSLFLEICFPGLTIQCAAFTGERVVHPVATRYLHPACGGEEPAYAECRTGTTGCRGVPRSVLDYRELISGRFPAEKVSSAAVLFPSATHTPDRVRPIQGAGGSRLEFSWVVAFVLQGQALSERSAYRCRSVSDK